MKQLIDFKSGDIREKREDFLSEASDVLCITPFPKGIIVSHHDNNFYSRFFKHYMFSLRGKALQKEVSLPPGEYATYNSSIRGSLEQMLKALDKLGRLSTTCVYLGALSDPLSDISTKLPVTTECLRALSKYKPGLVVFQTKTPLVVATLPNLKPIESRVIINVPLETSSQYILDKYLPNEESIKNRLYAAEGVMSQGLPVMISVCPLLPYGDLYKDTDAFTSMLTENSNAVYFSSISRLLKIKQEILKIDDTNSNHNYFASNLSIDADSSFLEKRLQRDGYHKYLVDKSFRHLFHKIYDFSPQLLTMENLPKIGPKQLSLFEAA